MQELYKKVCCGLRCKKAFIGSGIRYDLVFHQTKNEEVNRSNLNYLKEVVVNHVSGRLKVAPEHTSDEVLKLMRKPKFSLFGN